MNKFTVSRNERFEDVENDMGLGSGETILQVVLVALLASLTWGVPFPHGREGAPAAAEALLPDREHVQQDLHGRLERQQVQNITEDETRFHYFKSHDFDDNSALDGLEMLKAVIHTMADQPDQEGSSSGESSAENLQETVRFYTEVIDRVLSEDDVNRDGLLSYVEFVTASQRAAARQRHLEALKRAQADAGGAAPERQADTGGAAPERQADTGGAAPERQADAGGAAPELEVPSDRDPTGTSEVTSDPQRELR